MARYGHGRTSSADPRKFIPTFTTARDYDGLDAIAQAIFYARSNVLSPRHSDIIARASPHIRRLYSPRLDKTLLRTGDDYVANSTRFSCSCRLISLLIRSSMSGKAIFLAALKSALALYSHTTHRNSACFCRLPSAM